MYPNPDGSSYPKAPGRTDSKTTTGDFGVNTPDPKRSAGGPDALTQAVLNALTGGKPITTKTTE